MEELFTWLYDTYQEPLRGYLRSLGVPEDKLDDIIQESFFRLYRNINAIQREKLVPYLFTIAKNLAFDHLRHKKLANRISTDMEDAALQDIPDAAPTPEEIYEEKELLEELKKAVEKLPKKWAEAVKGLLDGNSFEVVAQKLDIQIPALKYRLRKARAFLMNNMQK
jgi:RNA polymerase sigma-70 factor, ECF subfamily